MGRGRILIYVLIFTALTINYIDRVVLSVSAPQIVKDFGISTIELGYLFSAFLWSYLVFVLPWGIYVDRAGTRVSTASGMAIWSIATLLTGMSSSFSVAFFNRLLMGFGEASTYPAGARTIREWMPAGERGLATTVFNCGGYAGPALGSILMGFIVSAYGWRSGFFVAGTLGFVWLIAWLVYFRQPETATFIGEDERRKILSERGGDTIAGTAAPVSALLKCRSIWGTFVTQGCAVYTVYLFLTWLPTYLQATRGLTILKSGFYTAVPCGRGARHHPDRLAERPSAARRARRKRPTANAGRHHDAVLVGHFADTLDHRHRADPRRVLDLADLYWQRGRPQYRAPQRPPAQPRQYRPRQRHPGHRRQSGWRRSSNRDRLCRLRHRQLRLRFPGGGHFAPHRRQRLSHFHARPDRAGDRDKQHRTRL